MPRGGVSRGAHAVSAGALLLLLTSPSAFADPAPSLNVRTWTPTGDPRGSLFLEPASSLEPVSFTLAAWARYENDSVTLRDPAAGTSRPVEDLFGLDVVMTLVFSRRGLVGVRLPLTLIEEGDGLPASVVASSSVPTTSLGDLALFGKGVLVSNDHGGFGLAALGELTFPTGSGTSFMSEGGPTGTVRFLADVSTALANVQASLGYMVRGTEEIWPAGGPGSLTFGNAVPWTLGVLVHPSAFHADPERRQTWEVALHGSLPGGPTGPFGAGQPGSAAESPALLGFSDRIALGHSRDGFVLAGVDVGIDHAVGVPSFRAVLGLGFTYRDHDRDSDGVPDDKDQCPTLPEDRDGFEDADGCPEADNDNDGVVDREDACPNVPGVPSPDPSKNGCPAQPPAKLEPTPSTPSPPPSQPATP